MHPTAPREERNHFEKLEYIGSTGLTDIEPRKNFFRCLINRKRVEEEMDNSGAWERAVVGWLCGGGGLEEGSRDVGDELQWGVARGGANNLSTPLC